MVGSLDRIEHVVVLMLENRSFDSMLGGLYPGRTDFDGLKGTEFNPDADGVPVRVWTSAATVEAAMSVPDPDPGELWTDITMQLYGSVALPVPSIATMSGFVRNYQAQTGKSAASYAPANVMHYYSPEQVPVLSGLARAFSVCDRWHASAPCQTWPNRFFVHTGTANGFENNAPPHFPYEMPTVFEQLEKAVPANPWKVYFHDIPQSLTLANLWRDLDKFRLYAEFQHDAGNGTLPAYSFIEPRYFADVLPPNDQHSPHVVTYGEQLIADVYNCLRSGPNWTKTLLVITYDEHGGCFDHVPPPSAVPPSSDKTSPFNFDRYGVRVPAVIVSPFVAAGQVLRPPSGSPPFDHTSIIATVLRRFAPGVSLTARDASAPDLGCALTLPSPDNLGPERIAPLPYVPSPAGAAAARALPLNHMQAGLLSLAAHLPATTAGSDALGLVDSWLSRLRTEASRLDLLPTHDMGAAVAFVKSRLGNLFRALC